MSVAHSDIPPGLTRLNTLPTEQAIAALLTCCHSHRWAEQLAAARPFATPSALHESSDRIWFSLSREDHLEAFSHHPRIGERNFTQPRSDSTPSVSEGVQPQLPINSTPSASEGVPQQASALTRRPDVAQQAAREQSAMAAATPEQLAEFTSKNAEYERRFNHVFLICATGKSASFMLDQLRTRLTNDPAIELARATREQSAITRLRLERWLHS